ncbi:MAG: asparagine synthetase B family protein [Candidatus Krumholzibacteriia bacterium]
MCGIAGVACDMERELGPLLRKMLESQQHRGPDGAGLVIDNECQRETSLDDIDFTNKKGTVGLGHVRLAITGDAGGVQPFQSSDGRLSLLHNGEIYNFRELFRSVMGREELESGSDSEALCRLLEHTYRGDLESAMEKLLPHLDGVYALAVTDGKTTVIARDRIGVRQLYYGFARGLTAFASEKKPLLALLGAGAHIHRLPPGRMMVIEQGRRQSHTFWRPDRLKSPELISDPNQAVQEYGRVLKEAVRKRVHDRDHVGIIYSGGIDSFLIAFLVQKLGVPFTCYVAGRNEGSSDIEWARKTAAEHDFPLEVKTLSRRDIGDIVPDVIQTIEDHSLNQVEVAIPVFAAIRMAQEAGERVVLTGQGADELFGGYPWYSTIVDREGYDSFLERSWEDTFLLYKECLEREDKIAMAHSIELRVPYLDPEVIRFAFRVAPQHKIRKGEDPLAKRIHRALGVVLGVPEDIAFRAKEAAQHGANVHDVFEELAVKRGYSPKLLESVGYDPDASVTEKLGSSSRYGYRYGDEELWEPMSHVQYYLDTQAAQVGLMTGAAKQQLHDTQKKLAALGAGKGGEQ